MPPRFALVVRLAVERAIRLHDVGREPVDVIGAGLAGCEHPPPGAHAARERTLVCGIGTGSSGSTAALRSMEGGF